MRRANARPRLEDTARRRKRPTGRDLCARSETARSNALTPMTTAIVATAILSLCRANVATTIRPIASAPSREHLLLGHG